MRRWAERDVWKQLRKWIAVWLWFLLPGAPQRARAEAPTVVPAGTFAAQITDARALAEACAASADACTAPKLPDRERVQGAAGGDFELSWTWLSEAMAKGQKSTAQADRAKLMSVVEAHLLRLGQEANAGQTVPDASFSRARTAANAALAREEFRAVAEGPSWLERQMARLQDWFLRMFTGMDRLGRRAPWLAPTIEWACFGLAAGGLLWFVRQTLARQALRIALSEGAALASRGERDSANWAQLAEQHASAAQWREAIHCLYWAAVALMETRRAWKPNATRTPREYLRLLRPGSEAQRALRELTRTFEAAWYGHAQADEGQYRRALGSFRSLEAAKPERPGVAGETAATPPPLAAAGGA